MRAAAALLGLVTPIACADGADQINLASLAQNEALELCEVSFDDFIWTHDIEGSIFVHAPAAVGSRLTTAQIDCFERWAATQRRSTFIRNDGRRPNRTVIHAKARSCGLQPERDLQWSSLPDSSERAVFLDRGATFDQLQCLVEWADHTGAPVGLAAELRNSN